MGSDQSTANGNRNRRENDGTYDNRNQRRQSSPPRPRIETPNIIIYERIRTPYRYSHAELRDEEARRQSVNLASPSQPHPVPHNPTPPPPYSAPVISSPSPNPAPTQPHTAPVNPTPSPYPTPLKHTPSQPSPATLNLTPSAPPNTNPPPSHPAPLYPNISHPHSAPINPTPSPYPTPLKQTPQPYPTTLNPPPSAPVNTNPPPSYPAPLNPPPPPAPVPTNHQAQHAVAPTSNLRDASPAPSSRSASRDGRNRNDKYKCPSCRNGYGLYIYQCPSGHSGCDECRNTATLCALCGLNFTDRRNYTLETFLNQMKVACPNASDGCRLYLRSVDMDTHVPECPFGFMDCPVKNAYGNCRWRGKPNEMAAHFDRFHPVERSGNVNTEYTIPDITGDSHNLYLVELSPYYFILHEKVDGEQTVYITVQLMGTAMSASKWNYEIHVYKKSEPRRKYTYTGPCFGIKSPVDDIFSRSDCAVLPFKYGKTLANDDRLTYKIFIKKQENDNPKNNFSGRGRRPPRNNANWQ